MIQYIKNNLKPLLIGLSIGLAYSMTINSIEDIVVKIALIQHK